MTQSPNIVLFSVHKDAMDAAVRAFAADWPEARISNLLDDGLFAWVRQTGGVVPEMYDAFRTLTRYMVSRGADGILFTCSAFREVIDTCIADFDVPILKPNDAMIEQALEAGTRIAVMATVGPTIPSISAEIHEMAAARGQKVELVPYVVEGAFDALAGGDAAKHDALVAARARDQGLRRHGAGAVHAVARRACGRGGQQHSDIQFAGRGSGQDARHARRLRACRAARTLCDASGIQGRQAARARRGGAGACAERLACLSESL